MSRDKENTIDYVQNISDQNISIYDPVVPFDPLLWIPTGELTSLLNRKLVGVSLNSLPLRSRSKLVKQLICEALGYTLPKSFKKTQPRFPGQNFDTYTQKSNNLQIWNEEISPERRYVIIKLSEEDIITTVKVVTGETIASLDKTGTLTQKHQAMLRTGHTPSELVSDVDTITLRPFISNRELNIGNAHPTDNPIAGQLFSISLLYNILRSLINTSFRDTGYDQERNRGGELQRLVCEKLGYQCYGENGQFPDLRHQLLEIKLQTSQTIDLGVWEPNGTFPVHDLHVGGVQITPSDVRYALFYARIDNGVVTLTHFYITTGESFFTRFPQMLGNTVNTKIQIPLPNNFFDY